VVAAANDAVHRAGGGQVQGILARLGSETAACADVERVKDKPFIGAL
jgi:hypothetical protein